jgi:hypothetical protein
MMTLLSFLEGEKGEEREKKMNLNLLVPFSEIVPLFLE